ncbi:MAG TPA: hypothetical protein VED59_08290, partial [Acidimicrobiales bacterium]|nr:hypothetical protein [Acidimicrobiales bacterium]
LRPKDNRGAHASGSWREWGGIGTTLTRRRRAEPTLLGLGPATLGWLTSAVAETTYTAPSAGRAM